MAAASLLALIDDIATLLDDVSVLTKVAAKKTAGVLGDDLAVNAEQVTGVRADRELPVVWAVFKGSLRNKAILVPAALAVSAVAPWIILPLLMLGGAFLCFEGFEKLLHAFTHRDQKQAHRAQLVKAVADPKVDLIAFERRKIRGAIRTDFILSGEIIVITLGVVAEADFVTRLVVLAGVAVLMTAGVYGVVAAIVKLDDLGLWLRTQSGAMTRRIGAAIVMAAPWLMRTLSVLGTAAMFLVGGGIVAHAVPVLHHGVDHLAAQAGGLWVAVLPVVLNALGGIVLGALAVALVSLGRTLFSRFAAAD
ncbi:DUF808 domain-containing protein [Nitrogeniibacter mangrovi]|uniref:DUF808 domain-containing protein n=1 Tax=Nitrogeniibacter mangrovi TaxID=2016596 RepID=A0A6C1AZZ1_9RHOO|nr:DUF808 domain-containing protein [Nitrogeniibacter mangrovi]QID16693.1 DUF808 domain-containing protein [Nitrogeniibacter mangrovi]